MDQMVTAPTPDLFSYAQLSREDEVSAREAAAVIKARTRDALQAWCDIGEKLKEQRNRLGIHEYHGWAKDEFGWDKQAISEFISIHEFWSEKVGLGRLSERDMSKKFALEMSRKNMPQEVRDQVEALLIDGQTVTVADIRRMKKEAADADAVVGRLRDQNAELSKRKKKQEIDVDAIREAIADEAKEEGRAEALADFEKEKHSLTTQLVTANTELRELREELGKKVEAENVVRPVFGADTIDPDLEYDDEYITEANAIDAFIGNVLAVSSLTIPPAAFWKRMGPKKGTHSKKAHEALLSINSTIGLLIKEYSK